MWLARPPTSNYILVSFLVQSARQSLNIFLQAAYIPVYFLHTSVCSRVEGKHFVICILKIYWTKWKNLIICDVAIGLAGSL